MYIYTKIVFYSFRNALSDIFWVDFDMMMVLSQHFDFTFDLRTLTSRSDITTAELNNSISETLINKLASATVSTYYFY